jgi:hypothetical protein
MKKFKLLSTSFIVALSFASSQASYGMDNNDENNYQKQRPTWLKDGSDVSMLPLYVGKKVLAMAIYQEAIETGRSSGNIEATCKVFQYIITNDKKTFNQNVNRDEKERSPLQFNTRLAFLEGLKVHYNINTKEKIEIFDKFYNGKLIYRQNPNSDNGKIELLISGLNHPFKGEFDLSNFGDIEKNLSINMGYRNRVKKKNKERIEIWLSPWFLIEKNINTTTKDINNIFPKELSLTSPIVIFWTLGKWDRLDSYDFLTKKNLSEISQLNLHNNEERDGAVFLGLRQGPRVFYKYGGTLNFVFE